MAAGPSSANLDPRTKFPSITSNVLSQIAVSLTDHLKWLDDHLEDVRNDAEARRARKGKASGSDRATSTFGNLMMSPVRKRTAAQTQPPFHSSISNPKLASNIFKPSNSPAFRRIYEQVDFINNEFGQDENTQPDPISPKQKVPSNSSLLRSPGKVGLNLVNKTKSPPQAEPIKKDIGPFRNGSTRTVLGQSTNSQPRQVLSGSKAPSPVSPVSRSGVPKASPTPRPHTRLQQQPSVAANSPPVMVVDDVFMMTSPVDAQKIQPHAPNEIAAEEDEEDEGDDDEVADILLGYTKTPQTVTKPGMSVAQNGSPGKELPPLPTTLTALHTSPGRPLSPAPSKSAPSSAFTSTSIPSPAKVSPARPARSPARPSPLPAKNAPVSAIPAHVTGKTDSANASPARGSPRPPPRNMSNLASIASVLGSPLKNPFSHHLGKHKSDAKKAQVKSAPKVPAKSALSAIPAPSATSPRPHSPAPRLAAGSPSKIPSATASTINSPSRPASPAPHAAASPKAASISRPTSPKGNIAKIMKTFSPPTRSSPRLAAQNSPAASPQPQHPGTRSPRLPRAQSPTRQKPPIVQTSVKVPSPTALAQQPKLAPDSTVMVRDYGDPEKQEQSEIVTKEVPAVNGVEGLMRPTNTDIEEAEPQPSVLNPSGIHTDSREDVSSKGLRKTQGLASNTTLSKSQAASNATASNPAIPPSPIFSSALSSNYTRPSAFSFAASSTGNPRTTLGNGGREKSIGVGLGLGLGLGRSLGLGLGGHRANTVDKEIDSQGSSQSAPMASRKQSIQSVSSTGLGNKRLSTALDTHEKPDSQGLSKLAKHDGASAFSSKPVSVAPNAAPLSKDEETKQRLAALKSRISTYQDSSRAMARMSTSTATGNSVLSTVNNRQSTYPSSMDATSGPIPSTSASAITSKHDNTGAANATGLFSPPLQTPALPTPQSASNSTQASAASASTSAASAASAIASAVASYVPAPPFASSFANFFSTSLNPLPQTDSAEKKEQSTSMTDRQLRLNEEKDQAADSLLTVGSSRQMYPSLPSMNNLGQTGKFGTNLTLQSKQALADEQDDREVLKESLIATERTSPRGSPATDRVSFPRRSSASSVVEIVSKFEAQIVAAVAEQKKREATLSPVIARKRKSSTTDSPLRADGRQDLVHPASKKAAIETTNRSTTPPFSPPGILNLNSITLPVSHANTTLLSKAGNHTFLSANSDSAAAGELILDIDDPEIDPIPRAVSVDTELQEYSSDDHDSPNEEGDESNRVQVEDNEHHVSDKASLLAIGGDEEARRRALSPTPFFEAPEDPVQDDKDDAKLDLIPAGKQPNTSRFSKSANTSHVLKKSASTSSFKPVRPARPGTAEPNDLSALRRPPSQASSVLSVPASRASTMSIASSVSSGGMQKSTLTQPKKFGLNTSTNARPEVKSLQLAAAAAKKENAEKERKALQKEEREQKRAAFLAAKEGDSEKERKRKDRDEHGQAGAVSSSIKPRMVAKTKPAAASSSQVTEEDPMKKRKMEATVEVVVPKAAVKKTTVVRAGQPQKGAQSTLSASTSRPQAAPASNHKLALASSAAMIGVVKQSTSTVSAAIHKNPLQTSTKAPPQATAKPTAQQSALMAQHQQAILKASQSLAKSQTQTVHKAAAPKPLSDPEPEPFELPEVDSEYSDSDEETQAKKAAARPVWTHSPELRQALALQAAYDPDELFGAIPQLHMEEMFKHKGVAARLRNRTSSANWSGVDALTVYEEQEYARRMGFKTGGPSHKN